jgi:acetate kinase
MQILVINSGSSTLKFDLVDVAQTRDTADPTSPHSEFDIPNSNKLAHGVVDRIGGDATFELHSSSQQVAAHSVSAPSHKEAMALVLEALPSIAPGGIGAVGHRVVHGGDRFVAPVLIDDAVIKAIEELAELAPLHNPPALDGIKAAREALGPDVPMVAVFDTAFHSTLPDYAYTYALPYDLARKHKIRRYGFHGTAHQYMLERYAGMKAIAADQANLITLQLGNGCSACAILGGKSVDTSMGFTPLEGLVMGTRSGDLDPSVVSYLAEKEGVGAVEVEDWLNKRSGLLGMSGSASDMRSLLAAEAKGDERARLAVEVFCYRVRKYIGAYMAALGALDAIVFGGGIGENAPAIRERILSGLESLGLMPDKARNEATTGKEGAISADNSPVGIYVVLVDESLLIARQTAAVVGG